MFRILALMPKVFCRMRGGIFKFLVKLAGGTCGPGMRIERGFRLRHGFHNGLKFGCDVYIGCNATIDCLRGTYLCVGDNTTFTQGIFISVSQQVVIGTDCLIGEYSSIRDANHGLDNLHVPTNQQPMLPQSVHIANNVWIGRGCAVLAGVDIGTGAVIGANSVVTRAIAAFDICAGAPAKTLRSRLDS